MVKVFNDDFKSALIDAIRAKINANTPFNKYELLLEVRKAEKQFYRYSDVRVAIEELINTVSEEEDVELISSFVRNADGKMYKVYEQIEDDADDADDVEENLGEFSNECWNIHIDKRNRATLPVELVRAAGFKPGESVNIIKVDDNTAKIVPWYTNPVKRCTKSVKEVHVEDSGVIRVGINSLFNKSNYIKVNAIILTKDEITVFNCKLK